MRAFSRVLRSAVATAIVLTGLTALPTPTHAASLPAAEVKQSLARTLAASLSDVAWARALRAGLTAGTHDAFALAAAGSGGAARFRAAAEKANAAVLAAKGLPATAGSVLDVRLAGGGAGPIVLVAADRSDDDAAPVTAYDMAGRVHSLSALSRPSVPVAVVGIDERRALAAGVDVVRTELHRCGVGSAAVGGAAGFWTTRLMSVRLSDDEEPWFKGDAEIYSIVSGVGVDGKPQVDIVQMPWLETDGTTYTPGQIVVDWSHFKYNAVDVVMMEEDDGTNYRALAQALATALLTVLDGVQYAPMVNAILAAMPDDWWTDDPDYVDSWYLLTRQTNEWRRGARQNAGATFAPYFVGPSLTATELHPMG